MHIPATTRRWTRYTARLFVLIAIVAATALTSTSLVDHQHLSRRSILASGGHAAINHVYRDLARAERARQRTFPHFANFPAAVHRVHVRCDFSTLAIAPQRNRSLDPVHVESGRSPPLRVS